MLESNLRAKWQPIAPESAFDFDTFDGDIELLAGICDQPLEPNYKPIPYNPEELHGQFVANYDPAAHSPDPLLGGKRGRKRSNANGPPVSHKKRGTGTPKTTDAEETPQTPEAHKLAGQTKQQVMAVVASEARLSELERRYSQTKDDFMMQVELTGFQKPIEWLRTMHTNGIIYTPVWSHKPEVQYITGTSLIDPKTRNFVPCVTPEYLIRFMVSFDGANRLMSVDSDQVSPIGLMAEYNYRWCKEAQANESRPPFVDLEAQFKAVGRRCPPRRSQWFASWLLDACGVRSCLEYGKDDPTIESDEAKQRTKQILQAHFSKEALPKSLRAEYGKPVWVMYVATQVLMYMWKHVATLHTRNIHTARFGKDAIIKLDDAHREEIATLKANHAKELELVKEVVCSEKEKEIQKLKMQVASLQDQLAMMVF